jgi:putative acetyltransferase
MWDHVSDLIRSDVELARILGEVEQHDDCIVVRTPHNPGFYFGNFLLFPEPPEDIEACCARFEQAFSPETKHRCFQWSGEPLSEVASARAKALGFSPETSVSLALDSPDQLPPPRDHDWHIRPLDPKREFERFEALNIRSDPADSTGPASYRLFKQRIRDTIRQWMQRGRATWWGVFEGDAHVAQCGFAVLGDLGRFQAVETHPTYQRRGICSTLIAHVARHAFETHGVRRVLLAADGIGPAVGLYRRLGFEEDGFAHSIVRESEAAEVRPEVDGDRAGVRSLNCAAFETPTEADLVDALRPSPGTMSLVASRSGAILGHILFTPVRVGKDDDAFDAVALGPMAVRPDRQRQGIGSLLVREGLEACRAAGHGLCFVLGHPGFYPRFGFLPAPPLGFTSQWDVPPEVFMVAALVPGALDGRSGRVAYDKAFDAV